MLMTMRGTFIDFSPADELKGPPRASSAPAPCERRNDTASERNYLSSLAKFMGDVEGVGESPSNSPELKSNTCGSLPFLTLKIHKKQGSEDSDGSNRGYAIESISTLSLGSLPQLTESMSALPPLAAESLSSLPELAESALPPLATESLSSLPELAELWHCQTESVSTLPEIESESTLESSSPLPTNYTHSAVSPAVESIISLTVESPCSPTSVALSVCDGVAVIDIKEALASVDDFVLLRKAIDICSLHSKSISVVFLWFATERGAAVACPSVHGLAEEAAKELLQLTQPVVGFVANAIVPVVDSLLLAGCSRVIAVQDSTLYVERDRQIFCLGAEQAVETGLVGHLVDSVQELKDDFVELKDRCSSGATSLMLCNLPCRLTQQQLQEVMASMGFGKVYDCIYFPASAGSPNLGYVFVNFVTAELAAKFIASFHHHRFSGTRSTKRAQVKIAKVQGRAAMMQQLAGPTRSFTRRQKARGMK